jgi:hypothetical protein
MLKYQTPAIMSGSHAVYTALNWRHAQCMPRPLVRRMAVRKMKNSLRRKKVEWADRAGSGPTGGRAWSASPRPLIRRMAVRKKKRKSSLRRKKWSGRTGPDPALPGGGRAWAASPRPLIRRMAVRVGKRKSSLRRKRVIWADRAGSALPVVPGRAWSASPRRR